jgi:hypothetical protein
VKTSLAWRSFPTTDWGTVGHHEDEPAKVVPMLRFARTWDRALIAPLFEMRIPHGFCAIPAHATSQGWRASRRDRSTSSVSCR